jgi:surface antigen
VASLRLIAVAALTLAASGCAMSGHFGSMLGGRKSEVAQAQPEASAQALASEDVTGSIATPRALAKGAAATASETDLVFARMAIVEVLGGGHKDVSAPWENPSSGARGTVTPIATAYTRDGATCRDFLASYVRQGAERWFQGEACRAPKGKWEVKTLRPWTRS